MEASRCPEHLCFQIYVLFLWHVEVPRLGVESELQLQATATATATLDLSHILNLHRSSRQHQILNPLKEARDQTPHGFLNCWAAVGTPLSVL